MKKRLKWCWVVIWPKAARGVAAHSESLAEMSCRPGHGGPTHGQRQPGRPTSKWRMPGPRQNGARHVRAWSPRTGLTRWHSRRCRPERPGVKRWLVREPTEPRRRVEQQGGWWGSPYQWLDAEVVEKRWCYGFHRRRWARDGRWQLW
jgi:hypothetical protein